MDFGFHSSIARALLTHVSGQECLRRSLQGGIDDINKTINNLDSRLDKQRFLEFNNAAFMLPKKFEFQGHKGDEVGKFYAFGFCVVMKECYNDFLYFHNYLSVCHVCQCFVFILHF